jgi:glycosyltransferase involved in cell wall biosynthesis
MLIKRNKNKTLSVIIPVMNEVEKIVSIVNEVIRLNPDYIVVVINGSDNKTVQKILNIPCDKLRICVFKEALGHDVGRGVGAFLFDADIYLFIDGDIFIKAEELLPFIEKIDNGFDVALNSIDSFCKSKNPPVTVLDRAFLNILQGKKDLGTGSMLSIPHALSKKAINVLGCHSLVNPMLANVLSIANSLKITIANEIDVVNTNSWRSDHYPKIQEQVPKIYQRIHGDAVEAIYKLLKFQNYPTENEILFPKLDFLDISFVPYNAGANVSIVLYIDSENEISLKLLKELVHSNWELIIFVKTGLTNIIKLLRQEKISFLEITNHYDVNMCYVQGAKISNGHSVLFIKLSNVPKDFNVLNWYVNLPQDKPCIMLTDRYHEIAPINEMNPVDMGIYFLNITANQNSLTTSSMLLAPYSLNKSALELLGSESLIFPLIAQMKAFHLGINVDCLRLKDQRFKAEIDFNFEHFAKALLYWIQLYGPRAGFDDGKRLRHIIPINN